MLHSRRLAEVSKKSFVEADRNLEQILHSICQKKWENEVVATKGKPHSIEWVFAQAQDCYFVRADPKEFENTYDNDFDDEPNPGRADWYQVDKMRVKIKPRVLSLATRVESGTSSKRSIRSKRYRKSATLLVSDLKLTKTKSQFNRLKSHNATPSNNPTIDSKKNLDCMSEGAQGIVQSSENETLSPTLHNGDVSPKDPLKNTVKKEQSVGRKVATEGSGAQFSIKMKRGGQDSESNYSGQNFLSLNGDDTIKRSRKTTRVTAKHKAPAPQNVVPKPIPLPVTEQQRRQMDEDERFYESTLNLRAQLVQKQIRQTRKASLFAKKMSDHDKDALYRIEQSCDYMKPLNMDRVQGAVLQQIQAKVISNIKRIPVKVSKVEVKKKREEIAQHSENSQLASIRGSIDTKAVGTPQQFDMVIDENTRLVEVLADELESKGIIATEDQNGFQLITGLLSRYSKDKAQMKTASDDYRGSLSAVKTISVVPGVELREFKDDQMRSEKADSVTVSGGVYRYQQDPEDSASNNTLRMSIEDYAKLSGTRNHFPNSIQAKTQSPGHAKITLGADNRSGHIRVIEMSRTAEEPEIGSVDKASVLASRLFQNKTLKPFAVNKHQQGRVLFNPEMLKSDERTVRSVLEQRQFVQNVMMVDLQDSKTGGSSTRKQPKRPQTRQAFTTNQSMNSSMVLSSINPNEHRYARLHDLKLNAKFKKRSDYTGEDIDSVNRAAGMESLHGASFALGNQRQKSAVQQQQQQHPYYSTETRLTSTRLQSSSIKTRAQTSQRSIREKVRYSSAMTKGTKQSTAWIDQMIVSGGGEAFSSRLDSSFRQAQSNVPSFIKALSNNNSNQPTRRI